MPTPGGFRRVSSAGSIGCRNPPIRNTGSTGRSRHKQYDPGALVAVCRGERDGPSAPRRVPPGPADSRSTWCPTRSICGGSNVSQPGAVRCAIPQPDGPGADDLVGLFVGHNFALKGLKPLLSDSVRGGGDDRSAADSSPGLRRRESRAVSSACQEPGNPGFCPFPRLPPGCPRVLLVERFLRPADLL